MLPHPTRANLNCSTIGFSVSRLDGVAGHGLLEYGISSSSSMPSPGPSGTLAKPSATTTGLAASSVIIGLGPLCQSSMVPRGVMGYSHRNPRGMAATRWMLAAKLTAVPQLWGTTGMFASLAISAIRRASVSPPTHDRSGCSRSTARRSIRSRKAKAVMSDSPAAMRTSVRAVSSAMLAASSALESGSSHQ